LGGVQEWYLLFSVVKVVIEMKLRTGDYRVVLKIMDQEVYLLGIIHREKVNEKIGKRI
jgi:hypothetical protein